jgi:hypothetical protein
LKATYALVVSDPGDTALPALRTQCREIFDRRDEVIGVLNLKAADGARRQVTAIERLMKDREGREDAQRAARTLECAVGAALGKPRRGERTDLSLAKDKLTADDCWRFRLMYQYRAKWMPELQARGLSRAQVLTWIALFLRKDAALTRDEISTDDLNVLHGNFVAVAESIADDSLPLIFTDPPYHDSALPLYRDLGVVAARTLRTGGSLITYTSHHRMPDVIRMLQDAGLTFFWPLAMVHSGSKARMTEYGIVVHWKPLLWFVKGRFRSRDNMTFVNDLIVSEPEKDTHAWQQGRKEAAYYIEALTVPQELIFDPCCGGGTTAIAAYQTGRRWLTCDIDADAVVLARQRLHDSICGEVTDDGVRE